MRINDTAFGEITIGGKTYDHDVIVRLSGKVVKRKKKLSKKLYGTSHIVSKEEAKFVFEKGCDTLILGAGQQGSARLSPRPRHTLPKKAAKWVVAPTPEAIHAFNKAHGKKVGLFHVTC
jgi:hypothetical protein